MYGIFSLVTYVWSYHAHFRSGELATEYEEKKKAMQQAQEETNFSYHKKRVHSAFSFTIIRNACKHTHLLTKGIAMEKKEARAEKEEAEKYQKLQDDLVSLSVAGLSLFKCLSVQIDTQLQEQLFKLYHNERQIDDLVDQVKTKQKELDKLVSLSLLYVYIAWYPSRGPCTLTKLAIWYCIFHFANSLDWVAISAIIFFTTSFWDKYTL